MRVFAYVDGFNLYYGLREKGWERYKWLDVQALVQSMVRSPAALAKLTYVTALNTNPPDRYQRHKTYVDALSRGTDTTVCLGNIEARPRQCPGCGHKWKRPQEKQSDVLLALAMVTDAIYHRPDEVYLLSADSDLVPAVQQVQELGISVTVLRPPRRNSDELQDAAHRTLHISRSKFAQSLLPNPVTYSHRGTERKIHCPEEWLCL